MADLPHSRSQKKYSWWWDSHISPKNSKWLQENLTDMDSKVKSMIKLIEEDADSFARRAEMYYKKRPELMKLVEDFYRAYRALAERYDHATGALRQAHRTMSEAFPNQIPMMLPDDGPEYSDSEADPRTPKTSTPVRVFFNPDDLPKNSSGPSYFQAAKKNGQFAEALESLKQLNGQFGLGEHAKFTEGRARKGLNFHESVESDQVSKSEKEILNLKETIAKLEAEKEDDLNQYQQCLESLSKLEAEVSRAQEHSTELNDKASKAEAEAQALKEALFKLEAEKEDSLLQYQLCLDNISNLENMLSHAQKDSENFGECAKKAETEVQTVKQDLARAEAEKDDVLSQYKQSLEVISDLENKILHAEESARKQSERAKMAEGEVETLKQIISKLTAEKDAAALQYQQCLETIAGLERIISSAHEETQRLSDEIDKRGESLKGAEERCIQSEMLNQSLHSELETVLANMSNQNQELTEKQKELGRLWTCIQEERLRFIEAETAFQTLQHLHSKAQDELRSLASELQNRSQTVREMQTHNKNLLDEILKIKEENTGLIQLNQSSNMSMESMQGEIFSLREMNGKLGEEVELRVDQRNALQQEIYCLKQELKDLNDKQQAVLKQVDAVGLIPECIETSVKELQDENSNLRKSYQKEKSERVALIEKLEIFEKLLEKNALLENSLADMSVELEAVRGKIVMLEESCESLLQEKTALVDEKVTLMTQLQLTTDNLGKLSATSTSLQNSLDNAHNELEEIKAKAMKLEDSCMLLVSQKSSLINEKDTLVSEYEITQQRLKGLEKNIIELEEKYLVVEKEKLSALEEVQVLKVSLEAEKHEHACFSDMRATQLAGLETQVHLLEKEKCSINKALEKELDKALNSQVETSILQSCVQDLGEKHSSLLIECQKLLEASKMSEFLVSKLEQENIEQTVEVKSLSDQLSTLKIGMRHLLMALDIIPDHRSEDKNGQDEINVDHILRKLQDTKHSLCKSQDENQLQAVEISILVTLFSEMRSEAAKIATEKSITDQELAIRSAQCAAVQSEAHKLSEITEKLRLDVINGCQKEKESLTQIDNLSQRLLDKEMAYEYLQDEKTHVLVEISVLATLFSEMRSEAAKIAAEKSITDQELAIRSAQCTAVQSEAHKLVEITEKLRLDVINGCQKEKELLTQIDNLSQRLLDKEMAYEYLQDEKTHVLVEISVLATLFGEMRSEAAKIAAEKSITDQELAIRSAQCTAVQSEAHKLVDISEKLRLDVINGSQKEKELLTQIDNLSQRLLDKEMDYEYLEDEKTRVLVELSVLVTLFSEMRSEAAKIAMGKSITEQELAIKSAQCAAIQSEAQKLFEISEKLRLDVINGYEKEKELMTQTENLSQRLLDKEMAYEYQQDEKMHVLDENRVLVKELSQLEEKNRTVEEETCIIFGEMLSLSLFSLILKNNVCERSLEMEEIREDLSRLQLVSTSLEKKLALKENMLEDLQTENQHLGEKAQKSGDELQELTCVAGQLSHEVASIKNLFHMKEIELLEAQQKLTVKEDQKTGLTKIVEDLKSKDDALQMIKEDLEKQIGQLKKDNDHLSENNRCLGEAKQNLEMELRHLHDKHETTECREASLFSLVQERKEEIDMLETQATTFYGEFQASTVAQILFQEKVRELTEECMSLHDETTLKDLKIDVLEKRIGILEGQNKELEAQFTTYSLALTSLMDSISSLEKHTFLHAHLDTTINEEVKDAKLVNQEPAASDQIGNNAMDANFNMQHLQARIKAIENAIVEMERLAMAENSDLHTKLESALRQIDEMSSETLKYTENFEHPQSEISEEKGLLPKDIMLDHISETSSYGISKRRYNGSDIQVLELWENTDQDSSIDLTVGKGKKVVNAPNKKEHSEEIKQDREYISSNSLFEKEVGVDNIEISKRFMQPPQDGNRRKVLERLNSDVQKLTNLQITVQDLKRKLESIEKTKKGKGSTESDTIKGKLEEAETAIQKLFDFNGKLMKNIEDKSSQTGPKSVMESEESGSARRKRISEQALRVSERIGRLQLEVQRIQFELLKLDDAKENKGKIRIVESKRRVLLRDYLYGGVRKIPKRKKAPLCACVEPRTKED